MRGRKRTSPDRESSSQSPTKRSKPAPSEDLVPWPDEFNELFKIFKTINTVIAFCSSRKNIATTFSVIRSSVESLLKGPLELERVAELKALLPDLIKFAYIPQKEHGNNEDNLEASSSTVRTEDHVLILDFAEVKRRGNKKQEKESTGYQLPPALSPAEVKKLILKRNERFQEAVNELIRATPENESTIQLLRAAAREHMPIQPETIGQLAANKDGTVEPNRVPDPKDRPSIEQILEEIEKEEWYRGQIVHKQFTPARQATTGELSNALSHDLQQALSRVRGVHSFYIHQAKAIDALLDHKHVIVSTSTASGKSLVYQVPVLTLLERDPTATAIFIYPTKALAQDQKGALIELMQAIPKLEGLKISTYDGDTPKDMRKEVRETASIIFTNFDTIHASILPHEQDWRRFLQNVKVVAVDELHYYSGLFGSHVAFIMRRFRRVCAAIGNQRIRFVSCSATLSSPGSHMTNIFGIDSAEVVDIDGAPSGSKEFLTWNPPMVDSVDKSLGRESSLKQATGLMRYLMKRGVRTILFCKIRKTCELAMKTMRLELANEGRSDILEKVMAYRGGYSREDRRRIEQQAFSGALLGIIATNALELGVDIGALDAVIMLGFPYSIANLRQQAGRAGRRSRDALAVFVADNSPIDQHYVQNPMELFTRSPEPLRIDLDSAIVLEAHLHCAGQEMPLSRADEKYFGSQTQSICESKLVKDAEGWYHPHPRLLPYPSKFVSIRGIQEDMYTVLDVSITRLPTGTILEELEWSRALFEVYEGGVFLHQGQTFLVREVSHDTRIAKVVRADVNWTTKARDFTDVDARQTHRIREIRGSNLRAFYGAVDIETKVFGFFKLRGGVIIDAVALETPTFKRDTSGWWMDVPRDMLEIMQRKSINAAEALHAACHAILNQFPMQQEVSTECKIAKREYKAEPSKRKRPARLMFYDSAGTGGTTAAKAFDYSSTLLHAAVEVVGSCPCTDGCIKCTHSPWCREGNEVSSKLGAQVVLSALLSIPIDLDSIPDDPQPYDPEMDTIVAAPEVPVVGSIEVERDA